ncbi:MAG: benzoyl-CoA reductase subunit D [Polyangiaceae bacterium]|nr:benzoyl-CoA reductase subunit D [Polyangiaceae bacterium]
MVITTGVDIGSSAVKVAVLQSPKGSGRERAGTRVLAKVVERNRRRDARQVIELAYDRALSEANLPREKVDYVATTGEGELVEFRTGHFYGMTAHARGAIFLDPAARAALDVGALHARAIKLDARAKVLDYRMTSQCASGTGQFLENIARYLGVTLEEIGTLSQEGKTPEKVSGICAVLAETDVINMVSRGISTANILRGIHESMAAGFAKLLRSSKVEGVVLVTGGLSADTGLAACLNDALHKQGASKLDVRTHPDAIYAGAIGAALWGAYRFEKLAFTPGLADIQKEEHLP